MSRSEFQDRIRLSIPDGLGDRDGLITYSQLVSMLRTAMMQGGEEVLAQARKSKFPLIQNRITVPVVEFERLRRFVEGK